MKKWIVAFRPKTLTAAVVPIMVGSALVVADKKTISLIVIVFSLLAALFIQIGTNLINDAMDFKKGADTEKRIGPTRITASGQATFKSVFTLGSIMFLLALFCGIPLVFIGGWPIVILGLISILCGYAYTSGPIPLAYKGLGDVFVVIFFGPVAVMGVYYLQTLELTKEAFLCGLQIGFLATVLIAINNFRDREQDIKAHKMTLAARFGESFARIEILVLMVLPFILNFMLANKYSWSQLASTYILLPVGVELIYKIFTQKPSELFNKFLAQGAFVHLFFGITLSLGLIFL